MIEHNPLNSHRHDVRRDDDPPTRRTLTCAQGPSHQPGPTRPRPAVRGGAAGLLSVLWLAACATEAPPPARSAYAPMNRVAYACQNGERLEVRFFPNQGVAVLVRDGRTQELQETRTASGVAYEGDGVILRGKGKEMLVQTRGHAPLNCLAAD